MKKIATIAASGLLSLSLAACGSGSGEFDQPSTDVTTASDYHPLPEPSTSSYTPPAEPEPSADTFDVDVQMAALQMTWDKASFDEQVLMCRGIALDEDLMLDSFLASAGGGFDRSLAKAFFHSVC